MVIGMFCIPLKPIKAQLRIPITYIYEYSDFLAANFVNDQVLPPFEELANSTIKVEGQHIKINKNLKDADESLEKISEQYKALEDLQKQWITNTDPFKNKLMDNLTSPSPQTSTFTRLLKQLKDNDVAHNRQLNALEKDDFQNTDADENRDKYYPQSVKDSLCPQPKEKPSNMMDPPSDSKLDADKQSKIKDAIQKITNTFKTPRRSTTYADLQADSCRIIYNATAYKKRLYDIFSEKKTDLRSFMIVILDAFQKLKTPPTTNSETIGVHNAMTSLLLTLEVWQQKVVSDYQLRLDKANIQIKIAQDNQMYAAQSIESGPIHPPATAMAAEAFLTTFGVASAFGLPDLIPYTQ